MVNGKTPSIFFVNLSHQPWKFKEWETWSKNESRTKIGFQRMEPIKLGITENPIWIVVLPQIFKLLWICDNVLFTIIENTHDSSDSISTKQCSKTFEAYLWWISISGVIAWQNPLVVSCKRSSPNNPEKDKCTWHVQLKPVLKRRVTKKIWDLEAAYPSPTRLICLFDILLISE